ncbi:hypothetical protein E4K10_13600 [Streptomyces sp. T1317-0309]|nr:hypothetical protein E4K10_13600 [Streptomyces sp. T1317-0309]
MRNELICWGLPSGVEKQDPVDAQWTLSGREETEAGRRPRAARPPSRSNPVCQMAFQTAARLARRGPWASALAHPMDAGPRCCPGCGALSAAAWRRRAATSVEQAAAVGERTRGRTVAFRIAGARIPYSGDEFSPFLPLSLMYESCMTSAGGLTEQETCRAFVMPALSAAGWSKDQIREQYSINDGKLVVSPRRHRRERALIADYVLEYRDDVPLAVVEAKRTSVDVAAGIEQAKRYARRLGLPVAYATNGIEIWEIEIGGNRHRVPSFPSPEELWQRYCGEKKITTDLERELILAPFDHRLRNNDLTPKRPRYYQRRAVNEALLAIARGQKRILLTLATGPARPWLRSSWSQSCARAGGTEARSPACSTWLIATSWLTSRKTTTSSQSSETSYTRSAEGCSVPGRSSSRCTSRWTAAEATKPRSSASTVRTTST